MGKLTRAVELALAIRMGAARRGALPIYAFLPDAKAAHGRDLLNASARVTPKALCAAIEKHAARTGKQPRVVTVKGVGAYVRDNRRSPGRSGRLHNVVTLITGAAQGLGRGIATEFAREGARVVIGDLNETAGRDAVAALDKQFGRSSAAFVRLDVTQLASICDACTETVTRFGGLDLLVSNAGVLKAGGIEELDEADFDFVTAVNFKGFYLCAKAAAPILRQQHRHHPGHAMDIVQVNSKSGLEGSNRNFAYAGGKFGGIGLVKSLALELVADGIKVNAVCPGNFFDGPLWSDPKQGLFVQYLKSGKVPWARSVADVRAFYMAKVPMKRGVTPPDIARAILYLREQAYETGQALPVTGGQIMLS